MFEYADFSCIEIVSKKRAPNPTIIDVEKFIAHLDRFILNNGNRSVGKTKLYEILKITRPILNRWVSDELLCSNNAVNPPSDEATTNLIPSRTIISCSRATEASTSIGNRACTTRKLSPRMIVA
ncbi:MAG: hypothetical protein LBS54_07865 [Dysgonamonadaceae bacterium]|nr:hypothetical protein [Dysgonamonadaceae bacterium]